MPVNVSSIIEDRATPKLNNVISNLSYIVETALDQAAWEVQMRMQEEAPIATGSLKSSITIIPGMGMFERVIKPMVDYAFYKETRDNISQAMPPISKIQEWADVVGASGKGVAFLIARKIAQTGYVAKPFVKDTYNWAKGQIQKWFSNIPMQIKIAYGVG